MQKIFFLPHPLPSPTAPILPSPLQHNSLSSLFVPTFCSSCNTGTVPQHMKAIVLWIIRVFAWNKMDVETLCLTKAPPYLCPFFFPLLFEASVGYIVSRGGIKGSYVLRGFTGCRRSLVLRNNAHQTEKYVRCCCKKVSGSGLRC